MNRQEVLAEFDRQMRREVRADDQDGRVERSGAVVRHVSVEDGWNGVTWSDVDQDTADAVIAEQVRFFGGRTFEWKLYAHDLPGDLDKRLLAAGFVPEEEEALMVAEVAAQPTGIELPEGVHLRAVDDAAGVDLMMEVHEQAFDSTASHIRQHLLTQLAAGPDAIVAVVAMAGDLPVSAARMELHPGTDFAGLWSGGTVQAWRGRGLYRALVAYRARIAAERGFRYLQVDASSQSKPILERLGFDILTTTTPYVFQGAQ